MADQAPLVILAGNIASGKSSLLVPLAEQLGLASYAERWEDNPWFGGPKGFRSRRLASELWFLLDSASNMTRACRAGGVLERWPDEHAQVFARVSLSETDAELVFACHARLAESVPNPDVLVYLQASPRTLLARIRERGRAEERDMTLKSLSVLDAAYLHLVDAWTGCPVVRIDTEEIDVRTKSGVRTVSGLVGSRLASLGRPVT